MIGQVYVTDIEFLAKLRNMIFEENEKVPFYFHSKSALSEQSTNSGNQEIVNDSFHLLSK